MAPAVRPDGAAAAACPQQGPSPPAQSQGAQQCRPARIKLWRKRFSATREPPPPTAAGRGARPGLFCAPVQIHPPHLPAGSARRSVRHRPAWAVLRVHNHRDTAGRPYRVAPWPAAAIRAGRSARPEASIHQMIGPRWRSRTSPICHEQATSPSCSTPQAIGQGDRVAICRRDQIPGVRDDSPPEVMTHDTMNPLAMILGEQAWIQQGRNVARAQIAAQSRGQRQTPAGSCQMHPPSMNRAQHRAHLQRQRSLPPNGSFAHARQKSGHACRSRCLPIS